MLAQLIESRPARRRHPMLAALSVALHAGAILALAASSGRSDPAPAPAHDPDERTIYQQVPDRRPTASSPGARCASCRPAPAPATLPPVLDVPVGIPEPGPAPIVDLDAIASDAARGLGGPVVTGSRSSSGDDGSGILDAAVVERPALAAPGNVPPRYPETLRAAGIEGSVLVELVIDTAGRIEPGSVRIVEATRPPFAAAVRAALDEYRFLPAEVGGRPVRVRVRLPFTFELRPA